ncbi:hypothetical protein SAY86_025425 [Trapa natans]|uniref:Uncharacterized protein n=1 Tax=Trapa natans TaxID=22666 RepID=A0AAN7RF13_TRANT|nr:hypothetical protein SAY86_025425 [Trapa natans]
MFTTFLFMAESTTQEFSLLAALCNVNSDTRSGYTVWLQLLANVVVPFNPSKMVLIVFPTLAPLASKRAQVDSLIMTADVKRGKMMESEKKLLLQSRLISVLLFWAFRSAAAEF